MLSNEYQEQYMRARDDPDRFWQEKALEMLEWSKKFTKVYNGQFGNDKWFEDGELNACYNCIDRWVKIHPNKTALIFDSNDGSSLSYTYKECLDRIIQICHRIKHLKKGDCITIYLAMSPEAIFSVLACARLGITHNVVFGGFSAESLKLRILDSKSKMVITQDISYRGDKRISFIDTVAQAADNLEVLVFDHAKTPSIKSAIKNCTLWSEVPLDNSFIPAVNVNAEHPLFYLYTSGSTGLPKGLIHSTGGYLLYASYTARTAFDLRENDIFCCTADIGWITGHSYSTYAPLCLGITTVILEGLPTHPSFYRFYDVVHKYKITQFYTAPTSIRILKKHFEEHKFDSEGKNYDFSSLRTLGSVGEPINREAHKFFSESFGNLHIVDTYWQTETGGIMIAPIMGVKKAIPECASLPMCGIVPFITHEDIKHVKEHLEKHKITNITHLKSSAELGKIYISRSWPGISRGILNDRQRYLSSYFSTGMYFTGDEGYMDNNGDIWIMGRADDVINVSGHRISTAEVESSACTNENVAEAAVISISHEIKGQTMILFVVLKKADAGYEEHIKKTVSEMIGGFCRPERVIAVEGIPKTATGKIMRRILRAIVTGKETGDLSTCVNKEIVESIRTSITVSK
jgi:acetyl-CoA synthetase